MATNSPFSFTIGSLPEIVYHRVIIMILENKAYNVYEQGWNFSEQNYFFRTCGKLGLIRSKPDFSEQNDHNLIFIKHI